VTNPTMRPSTANATERPPRVIGVVRRS
jgi:hypothetical protein